MHSNQINQRPTSSARVVPQCHTRPGVEGHDSLFPTGFSASFARSLLFYLCPLQSLCHAFSSRVKHNAHLQGVTSLISTPYRQPHPMSSTTVVQGYSGSSVHTLFKGLGPQDEVTRELIWGLGYSGSSLPSCPSLSSDNLLYKEDFSLAWLHRGRRGLVQSGVVCT